MGCQAFSIYSQKAFCFLPGWLAKSQLPPLAVSKLPQKRLTRLAVFKLQLLFSESRHATDQDGHRFLKVFLCEWDASVGKCFE